MGKMKPAILDNVHAFLKKSVHFSLNRIYFFLILCNFLLTSLQRERFDQPALINTPLMAEKMETPGSVANGSQPVYAEKEEILRWVLSKLITWLID